mgnify:CR=1 FL=1
MIAQTMTTSPYRKELADCVRRVNAFHIDRCHGAPEIPALKQAWVELDRNLWVANVNGDEVAARRAIDVYEQQAVAAIEEAAQ